MKDEKLFRGKDEESERTIAKVKQRLNKPTDKAFIYYLDNGSISPKFIQVIGRYYGDKLRKRIIKESLSEQVFKNWMFRDEKKEITEFCLKYNLITSPDILCFCHTICPIIFNDSIYEKCFINFVREADYNEVNGLIASRNVGLIKERLIEWNYERFWNADRPTIFNDSIYEKCFINFVREADYKTGEVKDLIDTHNAEETKERLIEWNYKHKYLSFEV